MSWTDIIARAVQHLTQRPQQPIPTSISVQESLQAAQQPQSPVLARSPIEIRKDPEAQPTQPKPQAYQPGSDETGSPAERNRLVARQQAEVDAMNAKPVGSGVIGTVPQPSNLLQRYAQWVLKQRETLPAKDAAYNQKHPIVAKAVERLQKPAPEPIDMGEVDQPALTESMKTYTMDETTLKRQMAEDRAKMAKLGLK